MLSDSKKEQITESLLSPSGGPEATDRTAATTGRDAPDDIPPVKAATVVAPSVKNPTVVEPKKEAAVKKVEIIKPGPIIEEDPELIAA